MACADQLLDLDDSVGKWPSDRPHGLTIRCGYCTPLPTPDNEGSCMVFWACQSHVTDTWVWVFCGVDIAKIVNYLASKVEIN